MPSPLVSPEQYAAWLLDPCTQALQAWALAQRQEKRDMWEGAHFESPTAYEVAIRNSAAIGACSVYREIEALDMKVILGDQHDEQRTVRYEDGQSAEHPDEPGY